MCQWFYTITITSLRTLDIETHHIVLVPKSAGILKILLEVESNLSGDYEVLTTHVHELYIERKQISACLFDLTSETKIYVLVDEKITSSTLLLAV
jgi:hypothetical protein